MIRAYVLIQTQVGGAVQVAREVSKLDGVTLAEAVTGPYDVVAQAEAPDLDQLGSSRRDRPSIPREEQPVLFTSEPSRTRSEVGGPSPCNPVG